ncbi:MAG TPA: metallophosphoesterase, partial [Flavobacterium sp.]|nr:metallophosphoesterase [Flavobacterium sp.]
MNLKIRAFLFQKPSLLLLLPLLVVYSCATHNSQFGSKEPTVIKDNFKDDKSLSHTFFLLGDAGNWDTADMPPVLSELEQRLRKADTSSTLLVLGDNIYPNGMPIKGARDRESAERKLNRQLAMTKNFKGRIIFLTGNHDWRLGLEGLNEQERMVNEYVKKNAFQPANSCALSEVSINDNTALVIVNSMWFLADWDKHPGINNGCAIITREQFFDELEVLINKNQNKTTILAMHHPLMTNGSHGGEYSLLDNLFPLENNIPLPVVGTIANLIRKTSGISVTDIQNKKYNGMAQRIKTIIANKPNVIVVSGHDHNLQYIENNGIRQIISGAGSKEEAAKAKNARDFSYGRLGYADVKVLKNGAAKVSFYGVRSGKEALLFEQQPVYARLKPNPREFPSKFASHKDTAVYSTRSTEKGRAYKLLWGTHYRKYYSTPVHVRQVSLDTLYGGLKPTISDGIDQSRTLLLESPKNRLYTMQAIKKSGTRLLQTEAFKDQSIEQDFRNTYTEDFILDFYTTAHPYAPLAASKLAGNIGLNHTNPELYFVPKQRALGLFNESFGDELYLVEQHPTNESKNLAIFGKPLRIVSTDTVLTNIRANYRFKVDQE